MKRFNGFIIIVITLSVFASNCDLSKERKTKMTSTRESVQFLRAKPIWPTDRELEKNLTIGFRGTFAAYELKQAILRITVSSLYRVFLNGEFLGHGPARAAHDFFRVDEWQLPDKLLKGTNVIAIEVAGYNVNSYYLLDQPAFLQAEVVADGQVQIASGDDNAGFEATVINERVQKVPRYSFQRPFIECYRLQPESYKWRTDTTISLNKIYCAVVSAEYLLPRRVKYPDFDIRRPIKIHSEGKIKTGKKVEKYWKDRSLTRIGDSLGGYKESELEMNPSITLQETESIGQRCFDRDYSDSSTINLSQNSFSIMDFGINLTGFIGGKIICNQKTRLFFAFDEILSNDDVDFKRLGCIQIVSYDLEPGTYNVESFEPYTLRYLKLIVFEGSCSFEDIYLREYVNSDISRASFHCSNDTINKIYAAAKETFRQNAVDIFMDCPSRERAGWLCDSYFTARVAMDLSGNTVIEKNFFENFLLPEKFQYLPDGMLPMCYPADHNDGVFIPNWALWFVVQLEEYYHRSNDREMVDALKPKILKLFQYFDAFKNQDGLLEKLDRWVFVEWSEANKFTQDVNYPSNMLFSGALAAAGRIYNIPEFINESEKINNTIREQSFNGLFFVDNAMRNANGKLEITNNTSEVCQYYAFFFDVASLKTRGDLWQNLLTEFGPARKTNNKYPNVFMANAFIGNYLRLELLSRYGKTAQLLRESMDNFNYMAERTGTLWENIGAYASCNHGFASHVAHVFYRDVLGIFEIDINKKKITLRFTDLDLQSCEGQIAIENEIFKLEWRRDDRAIRYRIRTPKGYQVAVENLSDLQIVEDS